MWFLRRRVRTEQLPDEKFVARFDFRGQGKRSAWLEDQQSFWLVLDKPEVELCLSDPGFDVGLTVRADVSALTRVYLGQLSLLEALRSGGVELTGRRDLRNGFHDWLGITPFAPARPAVRRVAAVRA
jgi:hypothetical protein